MEESQYVVFPSRDLLTISSTPQDVDMSNNYDYAWFNVKLPGPDLNIYEDYDYDADYYVGQESDLEFTIKNEGNEIAENVVANIYGYDCIQTVLEEPCKWDRILMDSVSLGSVQVEEDVEFNLSIIPTEKGYNEYYVNVSADFSVDSFTKV